MLEVAALFGLNLDPPASDHCAAEPNPPISVTLAPRQLIFITGPSGSGKSTLLSLIRTALTSAALPCHLIDLHSASPLARAPSLIDSLPHCASLDSAARFLSLAGLADAHLLLRHPARLSDGQRFRCRLACLFAAAAAFPTDHLVIALADEFASPLDRITARAVARSLRRFVTSTPNLCFIAASAHDDLLEPLDPDLLLHKDLAPGDPFTSSFADTLTILSRASSAS